MCTEESFLCCLCEWVISRRSLAQFKFPPQCRGNGRHGGGQQWDGGGGREKDAGLNHPRAHPGNSRRGTQTHLIRSTAQRVHSQHQGCRPELRWAPCQIGLPRQVLLSASPPFLLAEPCLAWIPEHSLLPWPPHDPRRARTHPVLCWGWGTSSLSASYVSPHDPWLDLCVCGCNEKNNRRDKTH